MKKFFRGLNKNILLYCMRLSWRASKKYTFLRFFLKVFSPVLTLASTLIAKMIINTITSIKFEVNIILILLIQMIIKMLCDFLLYFQNYISIVHDECLKNKINIDVMHIGTSVGIQYFDDPEFYNSIQRVQNDSNSIINVIGNFFDIINYLFSFFISIRFVLNINWIYLLLLLLTAIPSSIYNKVLSKKIYDLNLQQTNKERERAYLYSITLDKNVSEDIRFYNFGKIIISKYFHISNNIFKEKKLNYKKRTAIIPLLDTLVYFNMSILLYSIICDIYKGTLTIGDYILYSNLIEQLVNCVYHISSSYIQIYDGKNKIKNIKKFFERKYNYKVDGNIEVKKFLSLEFKNVSFKYPNCEKYILKNMNFIIKRKEKVALIGLNGAGKTTIIKLILGFYDVDEGEILINGFNIKRIKYQSLLNLFSMCFQKKMIYGFSMKDNIQLFAKNNNVLLSNALDKSGVDIIVSGLKDGIDTLITKKFSSNGIELSLGQCQKIGLARMLFRFKEVFIMDEPTASLDPESENDFFSYIDNMKDKTIIFISHRLSNLSVANKIFIIEDGKVLESGTHNYLISNSSRYKEIYMSQAERYIK